MSMAWQHTIADNNDRVVVVAIAIGRDDTTVARVTAGGDPMRSVLVDPMRRLSVWVMRRPTVSDMTIRVELSRSSEAVAVSMDYYGVAQAAYVQGVVQRTSIASIVGVSQYSAPGDVVLDFLAVTGDGASANNVSGASVIGDESCGEPVAGFDSSGVMLRGSFATGDGGTVIMRWDLGNAQRCEYVSFIMKPMVVRLTWMPVNGATGYRVMLFLGRDCRLSPYHCSEITTQNYYDIPEGMVCSTGNFSWKVVAQGPDGYCATSSACVDLEMRPSDGSTVDAEPPRSVTSVSATVDCGSVRVSWIDSSTSARGFEIQRREAEGEWEDIAVVPVGVGSYTFTDSSIDEDVLYGYRVRAFNLAGNGPWVGLPGGYDVTIPLCAPTGLAVSARDERTPLAPIQLTWQNNSAAADRVVIMRSRNGGAFVAYGESTDMSMWRDPVIEFGVSYTYRVCVKVNATGSVSTNSDDVTSDPVASSIQPCIQLGRDTYFYAPFSGTLRLYYNDSYWEDNYGIWAVDVSGGTGSITGVAVTSHVGGVNGVNAIAVVAGVLYRTIVQKTSNKDRLNRFNVTGGWDYDHVNVSSYPGFKTDADGRLYTGGTINGSGFIDGVFAGQPSLAGDHSVCPTCNHGSLVGKIVAESIPAGGS